LTNLAVLTATVSVRSEGGDRCPSGALERQTAIPASSGPFCSGEAIRRLRPVDRAPRRAKDPLR
jgi:hypothetical protein